jgi:hypothetical protein
MSLLRHITGWLNDLANLTAGNPPLEDIKLRAGAMASMLADQFPEAAFTRASLAHVARKCTFFPSYAELCDALLPWWQDNRPTTAITYDPADLNDEEHAIVQNWERHASGNWGKIFPLNTDRSLWFELGLYRRLRERVFNHLVANNEQAERIARRNNWIPPLRAAAAAIRPDTRYGPPDA